jgi:hypothetical protein
MDRLTFVRFFDSREPVFGHQVALGQYLAVHSRWIVLQPVLTELMR